MSVSVTRAALAELNEQYIKFLPTIQKLEIQLKQGVKELNFTENDFIFALEYIEDQVTIFRFLKDTDFDEEKAYQRIIDTILWRKEIDIGNITWETVHPNLFKSTENAFSFFYEQDLLGRPIAIIRMRHFPNFGNEKLYDVFPPFACLVMEMARKWTLDLTRQNELKLKQQQQSDIDIDDDGDNNYMSNYPSVLVSQITVIIDIAKAPMIPLEKKLIQELLNIMDGRFPGFFGSIYMMNFGWMYQGIWQMVKIMLSEKAKSKVNFPSLQEVKQYISEDRLLKELGGLNDYEWSLENDIILKKYGCGWKPPLPPVMSPDLSPITRPSRSPSVSSFSSVEFYDALETQPLQQQQPKLLLSDHSGLSSFYGTPGTLTPISTYTPSKIPRSLVPLTSVSSSPSSSSTSQYFLTGLHIPSFLSSIFSNTSSSSSTLLNINKMSRPVSGLDLTYRLNTLALEQQIKEDNLNNIDDNNEIEALVIVNQEQQPFIGQRRPHFPHLLPPDDPHSLYASSPLKMQLRRSEQRIIRFTRRLFRLSFAYNGTIYWILLYIFLRGPLENNIKKILTKMMINPRTITYTTVGLTASVAAGLSISLSNSLNH